ncbi:MAG TPA: M23 family metallopeptidase [Thermoanaerobaculia bacterium]|nr:M23 family metallopeptidase [Thermoanaerobaculia bacterium]
MRPEISSRLLSLTACSLLLLAPAAASAGGGERQAVDQLNGVSFDLPAGWHFELPDPAGKAGATSLMNYDPLEVLKAGEPQEEYFPEGRIKIDVTSLPSLRRKSAAAWGAARRAALRSTSTLTEPVTVSEPRPIELAGHRGQAYTVEVRHQAPVLEITLDWPGGRVLSLGIRPANSTVLPEVMQVLDRMRPAAARAGHGAIQPPAASGKDPAASLEPLVDGLEAIFDRSSHPCNGGGTFAGGEAPNSPITIHMPFAAGTRWRVGAGGSYFGNGYHCNIYEDYYSTDWNLLHPTGDCNNYQPSSGGQIVQPVADGTVVHADTTNASTGYGYHVIVEHAGGVRTRYAHLQTVYVTSGAVSRTTPIGLVGNTGNSSGPHLHLSFLQSAGGGWRSRCYNGGAGCPNGEASLSPQTAKPSPIQTTSGSVALADFGCYVSANSGGGGSVVIDDPAAQLFGPGADWFSASGLGQGGQMRYTWNVQNGESNYVYWPFSLATAGNYKIEVFIPSNHATTTNAQYYLWNGSAWSFLASVNQNSLFNAWVVIKPSVFLSSGVTINVKLTDNTGEATGTRKVGVDAIRITKL